MTRTAESVMSLNAHDPGSVLGSKMVIETTDMRDANSRVAYSVQTNHGDE